jgi:hypothetical protein
LPIDSTDEALFTAATRVTIHDGRTMLFWTSSWLNGKSLASLFPSLFEHRKRKKRTMANALYNDNWIADTMHNMFAPLLAEFILLWIEIDAAHFDGLDMEPNEITWTCAANGRYSASSAYQMQFDGSLNSIYPAKVWQAWAPSRCKFLNWLLLQNRVWTADRLMHREWPNEYFCPLCYLNLETAAHLMFECPTSCFI